MLPAKHPDTPAAFQEIGNLLGGYFRSGKTHAFHYDAVVCGEDNVLRFAQIRSESLLYCSDLYSQFFQSA